VKSPIDVLPTGIDIDRFASGDGQKFRQQHGIAPDTPVVGHLGRLASEKNLHYLAHAVAQTAHAIPELIFLVAGTGDAQDDVIKIFSQQGVENSLLMVGTMSGNDLVDCYSAMDIFVFASRSETQGLVLAEAMAASVPVITLSATGVDDVVENDVNGILLDSSTPEEEFSMALRALLVDSRKIVQLRKGCGETVKSFSRHTSCVRLAELYEEVIHQDTQPFTPELDIFDSVMQSIKTEWELLQKKTTAAINSIAES
jgi:glycosyltransferase involved in cell wall biosynthesis